MIVDLRRKPLTLLTLTILSNTVSDMDSFRSTISWDLKWTLHIAAVRMTALQRLHYPTLLSKFNLAQELLITFHSAIIQSALCWSVWFGSATKQDKCTLQQTVRSQLCPLHTYLHSIQDQHGSRVRKRTGNIYPHIHKNKKTGRHRDSFFLCHSAEIVCVRGILCNISCL